MEWLVSHYQRVGQSKLSGQPKAVAKQSKLSDQPKAVAKQSKRTR